MTSRFGLGEAGDPACRDHGPACQSTRRCWVGARPRGLGRSWRARADSRPPAQFGRTWALQCASICWWAGREMKRRRPSDSESDAKLEARQLILERNRRPAGRRLRVSTAPRKGVGGGLRARTRTRSCSLRAALLPTARQTRIGGLGL